MELLPRRPEKVARTPRQRKAVTIDGKDAYAHSRPRLELLEISGETVPEFGDWEKAQANRANVDEHALLAYAGLHNTLPVLAHLQLLHGDQTRLVHRHREAAALSVKKLQQNPDLIAWRDIPRETRSEVVRVEHCRYWRTISLGWRHPQEHCIQRHRHHLRLQLLPWTQANEGCDVAPAQVFRRPFQGAAPPGQIETRPVLGLVQHPNVDIAKRPQIRDVLRETVAKLFNAEEACALGPDFHEHALARNHCLHNATERLAHRQLRYRGLGAHLVHRQG
mmetsp:Transcript_13937/g.38049  ORF Transcript_13937/g.38049 Transcript_13937/m.38049 type:complete len:278 (+) Transcript_13937:342-1175(+)